MTKNSAETYRLQRVERWEGGRGEVNEISIPKKRKREGNRYIYYAKYYGKGDGQLGKKMKKGKEKRRKITLKKGGGEALKMHLYGL